MLGYAREIRKTVQKELKQIPLAKVCISTECFIGLIIKTKMCSKLLLILLVLQLTQVDAQSSPHRSFLQWKQQHAKNYVDQTEQLYRFYIYSQNVQRINQHNSKADRTYEQGVNQFSDLTWEEFQVTYLTVLPPPENNVDANRVSSLKQDDDEPEPWVGQKPKCRILTDFSSPNATNSFPASVRNQGGCGAAYAFSTLSAMTTALSLKGMVNAAYEFSSQEIVDCNKPDNSGCNGGGFIGVYKYAKIYAISPEQDYPYTGQDGTCDTNAQGKGLFKLKGYQKFSAKNKFLVLKNNIHRNGPQAMAVTVSSGFTNYKSGVLTIADCPADPHNHAVMVVGYDDCKNIKLQNSWGTGWGVGGFIWLSTVNDTNVCNIHGAFTYLPNF